MLLESVLLGATGWVAGLVNAFPEEGVALFDLAAAGHWEEARRVGAWFMPLLHLDTKPKLVQYIKLAMQLTGLGSERVRPPRLPLVGAERAMVERLVRRAIATRPAAARGHGRFPRRSRCMTGYLLRRLAYMIILLAALSVVVFIVIQLPPGDVMTVMLARMEAGGADASFGGAEVTAMQEQYGLHLPAHLQYLRWAGNLLRGNLGVSFVYGRPVTALLLERLPLTVLISGVTLLFAYAVAIPIGIYSATHHTRSATTALP